MSGTQSRRRRESWWQRFWRRYRMRSLRNTSDHAAYFAIGMFVVLVVLAVLLFFGLRGAEFKPASRPGNGLFDSK